jgi:hypothetical protein
MSWDNFNESGELKAQIEASECFHGILSVSQFMPLGSIGQEKTEQACQERGIRISEPLLGRPPTHVSKEKKKQALSDERIRNAICQKVWGLRKRRFSLVRVMAKLDNTSQTTIAIAFLLMNLSTWLRRVFCVFLCRSGKITLVFGLMITKIYNWGNSLLQKLIFNSA